MSFRRALLPLLACAGMTLCGCATLRPASGPGNTADCVGGDCEDGHAFGDEGLGHGGSGGIGHAWGGTDDGPSEVDLIAYSAIPRELDKASLPVYRIEPPDVLLVETVSALRPAGTRLRPGDQLAIRASNTLPFDPTADDMTNAMRVIDGEYLVNADGTVDLGPVYGDVPVQGLTAPEAETAIVDHLRAELDLKDPQVSLNLINIGAPQPITGPHLVAPDGTIDLGLYGRVYVAGATVEEARAAVEAHLAAHIQDPEVRVSVLGYNSKALYVITDGGGFGEQVVRLNYTGSETVLDAVSQIQGLSDVSSKNVWVARPSPADTRVAQTLPVDWRGITQDGMTATNYQLFPGDRIYIKADHLITTDNLLSKLFAPVERIMGVTTLGVGTVQRIDFYDQGGRGGFGGGFGGGF